MVIDFFFLHFFQHDIHDANACADPQIIIIISVVISKIFVEIYFNDIIKYGDFCAGQKLQKQHAVLINI